MGEQENLDYTNLAGKKKIGKLEK